MYINISYKFHRIPDRQSRFIAQVYDLLGQPLYVVGALTTHVHPINECFHHNRLFYKLPNYLFMFQCNKHVEMNKSYIALLAPG